MSRHTMPEKSQEGRLLQINAPPRTFLPAVSLTGGPHGQTRLDLDYLENIMAKAKATRQRRRSAPDVNELLVMELQQIHSAESQLTRALPRLSKAAQSQALRTLLDQRVEEGQRVLQEVESTLEELDESPGRRRNVAAEGLISDVREHVQEIEPGPALDTVMIAGIQKTEHYCIAAWGTARALAQAVDEEATVEAMQRALDVGGAYDQKLTKLAEEEIMPALVSAEEAAESEEGESDDEAATDEGGNSRKRKNGGRAGKLLAHGHRGTRRPGRERYADARRITTARADGLIAQRNLGERHNSHGGCRIGAHGFTQPHGGYTHRH